MAYVYMPIMAPKKGEFTALGHLSQSVQGRTLPLFELGGRKPGVNQIEKSIARTAQAAGKVWSGRRALLDASKWRPNDRTENRIHVLEYAFDQFQKNGIELVPVVGYDRWDDPSYRSAVENIVEKSRLMPCIRIDRESLNDEIRDVEHFGGRIRGILDHLELAANECLILLDFESVSSLSVPDFIALADVGISTCRALGFSRIAIAGGSMPATVDAAVQSHDSEGCIPRVEMMGWRAVVSRGASDILLADYVIRCPSAVEGIISRHANAKIRYTIKNQFFILRGHSKDWESLERQHKVLAEKLISSHHCAGPQFSWGDSQVMGCALGNRPIRDATTMISVDSNHHIVSIMDEILEHRRTVTMPGGLVLSARE